MMVKTAIANIVLAGWLWPFGESGVAEPDTATIQSLENRVVELPDMQQTKADSGAALAQYRLYLEMPEGDPGMRMEAMRRLGDLSLRAGEDEGMADPEYVDDMVFHGDAIRLYEELLVKYDSYEKADLVLYQLGRAYESAGQPDKALATLDRLVADYPESRYIDEAQFRRGEILFMQKNYLSAGSAYRNVVEMGSASTFYQQALYKHGWAQFKQADYDAGLTSFLDLLNLRLTAVSNVAPATDDSIEIRLESMSRADKELVNDALRVVSLSFSYLDGQQSIGIYLDKRRRVDSAYLLYGSLGNLYLEKERYLDAAETFDGFVQREPFHRNAPLVSMQVIDAYKQARFPSLVLEGKQKYITAYGLTSDYWGFHDPAFRPDVIQPLKENLSDMAQHDHAEAQKTGEPAAYARAADWYRRYLEYFPNDPESAQRSFLLGEILMESKSYEEAAYYYLSAAYDYPQYDRAAEAGYAALLASRAHYSTLTGASRSTWQQQQLRQGLTFAQSFPGHAQAGPVLSDAAESFYSASELDEAVLVAGEVLKLQPPVAAELRRVSWTVVAHGQFDLGHYPRAEHAYVELRAMGPGEGVDAAEIDERIAASVYRQAEASQADGDVDAAVADYLRVATVAPGSSIRASATYDAATLLINESRWDDSIAVLNRFRRSYPEHEFADDVTKKLAVAYRESGQSLNAAAEFERIATMSGGVNDVNREALWTSAELYEEAGSIGEARRVWKLFVADFPTPVAETIEVRQRLADLATQAGDTRDRRDWLESIINADAVAGSNRSARTRTLAAAATLELADPKREAFNAVRLKAPLADILKLKKSLMESALSAYNDAAGYEIADVTTVATFRIAELYQQLSIDLFASERPQGLSDEELEQYDILLEEQAFPFEEKAIELYEVNASRSASGVYDEWVASSFEQLAVLMPARYAKFEKAEIYVAELR
jgi:TolA-binding protein